VVAEVAVVVVVVVVVAAVMRSRGALEHAARTREMPTSAIRTLGRRRVHGMAGRLS
jgi:hypothetical protein